MVTKRIDGNSVTQVAQDLMLDTSEGVRLNTVTSNYGFNRPAFGFSDDVWRAVAKELQVNYRQILNKFHSVLSIMLGPNKTQYTALRADAPVGSRKLWIYSSRGMPQTGVMVIDEGLPTEETIRYGYIDRTNEVVYLNSATQQPHSASQNAPESIIYLDAGVGDTQIYLSTTEGLEANTTIILSPGTENEEVAIISAVYDRSISLTMPLTKEHKAARPKLENSGLASRWLGGTYNIEVQDISRFPEIGYLLVGSPGRYTVTGESPSTTTSVEVTTSVLTQELAGMVATFSGNVTPALAGARSTIVGHGTSTFTLSPPLPAVPQAGDLFSVTNEIEIDSVGSNWVDVGTNALVADALSGSQIRINGAIYDIINNTESEIFIRGTFSPTPSPGDTFSLMQKVQYTSSFYLDNSINSINHSAYDFPVNTPVELLDTSESIVGSAQVQVKGASWEINEPFNNCVEIVVPNELEDENTIRSAAYLHGSRPQDLTVEVTSNAAIGDTQLSVAGTDHLPPFVLLTIGTEVYGAIKSDSTTITLTKPLTAGVSASTILTEVDTVSSGIWNGNHTYGWLGPYIYSTDMRVRRYNYANPTRLAHNVAAPTTLNLDAYQGFTAIEVEDASFFPPRGSAQYPLNALIGRQSNQSEVVSIQGIALKSMTYTRVAVAASAGDLVLKCQDVTNFVDGRGYRVSIGAGTPNHEVVIVRSVDATAHEIYLEEPITSPHAPGERVELVSDVLRIDTLNRAHVGRSTWSDRQRTVPNYSVSRSVADSVEIQYSGLELESTTGLYSSGYLILNHSSNLPEYQGMLTTGASAGATSLSVGDASRFANKAGCPIVVGRGQATEEVAYISHTTSTQVHLQGGLKYTHAAGAKVYMPTGKEELIEYTSITNNTIILPPHTYIRYNHSSGERVIGGGFLDVPRVNGYDYAWHIPSSLIPRLEALLDRIRAAGIKLTFRRK